MICRSYNFTKTLVGANKSVLLYVECTVQCTPQFVSLRGQEHSEVVENWPSLRGRLRNLLFLHPLLMSEDMHSHMVRPANNT